MVKKFFKKNSNLKNSILLSLEYNSNSLDYVENEINRIADLLKYKEEDIELLKVLNCLKYIKYCLQYLENNYDKVLRGVK